jgi:hypothetical protein
VAIPLMSEMTIYEFDLKMTESINQAATAFTAMCPASVKSDYATDVVRDLVCSSRIAQGALNQDTTAVESCAAGKPHLMCRSACQNGVQHLLRVMDNKCPQALNATMRSSLLGQCDNSQLFPTRNCIEVNLGFDLSICSFLQGPSEGKIALDKNSAPATLVSIAGVVGAFVALLL